MTQTIKAADARGFLSLVPSMLGYTPVESLILLPFKDGRTLGAMRVDLPRPDQDPRSVANTLIGMVCKLPDANGLAAVVYTDHQSTRFLALLNAVLVHGNDCGLVMKDLLYVAHDGWGSLIEGADPRPVTELVPPAEAPPVAGTQYSSAQLPANDPAFRDELSTAIRTFGGLEVGDEIVTTAAAVIRRKDLGVFSSARLVYILDRPAMRDIAINTWMYGVSHGRKALEAQLAWQQGVTYPEELGQVMWGVGPRPDADDLQHLREVLRTLTTGTNSAGVLATLSWVTWALGRATEAEHYANLALDVSPDHGLAQIMRTMISAGHLPEWAFKANS